MGVTYVRSQGFPVCPQETCTDDGQWALEVAFAVTVSVASFLFCQLGTEMLLNLVSPLEHNIALISSKLWLFGLFCGELHCPAEIASI